MTFAEIFLVISILALAGWAFYSMRRAMRHDADWRSALKDFAKTKGLVETTAEKAPGEFDSNAPITWKAIRRAWSRNPAVAAPIKGSVVFRGANNGFPFVMDEVWIRKYWTNLRDPYLRMAIELPGIPATLAISPSGRLGRRSRGVGSRSQRANLTIRSSAAAGEHARERSFLTAHRFRVLGELEEAVRGVYVYGGKLFVIRRTDRGRQIDLNTLYDALGMCAQTLAG